MTGLTKIRVNIETRKLELLQQEFGVEDPDELVRRIFDFVYRYYVVGKDALISKAAHDKEISEYAQTLRLYEMVLRASNRDVRGLKDQLDVADVQA